MERKFQPKIKMIAGVSNIWLQDILKQIVDEHLYELVFTEDLRSEDLRSHKIVVVDIDDYPVRCSQLFREIIDQRPGIGIVAIVSDSAAYRERITQMGANAVVGKDELVDRFDEILETLIHGLWLEGQTRRILNVKNFLKKEKNAVKKTTENKSSFFKPISRRTFLTGSAAAMAALAITACADTGESQEQTTVNTTEAPTSAASTQPSVEPVTPPAEEIYYGSCRANCFGGCRMKIKVRDGRVVGTAMGEMPDPRYNRICAKGYSHVNRIYDPDRLKAPLRRVGERGSGQWEQISWEEAITQITDTWKSLQSQYGDESVSFMSASGNFASIAMNAAGRLKALMGGSSIAPCFDANMLTGTLKAFGMGDNYNSNELIDLLEAKTIMIWGSNPCDAQIQNWKFIRQAQKKGAKLICVDPNYTATVARSDIHVPLKPGSDGLLALAMCNIVIEENWTDKEFLKNKSVAPFLVKKDGKYLRMSEVTGQAPAEGEVDAICVWDASTNIVGSSSTVTDPALNGTYDVNGIAVTTAYDLLIDRLKEYTVDRAVKECGLSKDLIYEITEIYAKNTPSTLFNGYGPDHYTNGHAAVFANCCLAMLTGNVGKVGANAGMPSPYGFYMKHAMAYPEGSKPTGRDIPAVILPEVMENKTFLGAPIDIHSMYIWNANPVANLTDRKAFLKVFDQLDLVVVADMTMGDTAQYADIVLPVAHWFEVSDMHGMISQVPYLMLQEKAMDPLYECKSDLEIARLLGEGMGFTGKFDVTPEEWMKEELTTDYAKMLGISYERLMEEKVLRYLPSDPYIYGEYGFATATGRAQFYDENPAPNTNIGQTIDVELERLPYWEAPAEAWTDTDLAKKYPLIFGQLRSKYRVHTQWGTARWMEELDPEPVIMMNSVDAEARGIKHGDMVKAYNDRGYVIIKAVINEGARPGMIIIPKGWQKGQFVEGHYSDLSSRACNPASLNNCFYDARLEVEKI